MIKVEELFIEPTATVLETLRKLDETGQRILFIAPEGKLKAVITDGDIRKFFLRGGTPDQTIDNAANYHPLSVPVDEHYTVEEPPAEAPDPGEEPPRPEEDGGQDGTFDIDALLRFDGGSGEARQ